MNVNILIFRIRKSRLKARELALKEVETFLDDIPGVEVVIGGPLSTEKGGYLPHIYQKVLIFIYSTRLKIIQNGSVFHSYTQQIYKVNYLY